MGGDERTNNNKRRRGRFAKALGIINIALALCIALYLLTVFTEIPPLNTARDLWIETAMTTADHQWLATRLFPRWLVDRVMSKQVVTGEEVISNPGLLYPAAGAAGLSNADSDDPDADTGDGDGQDGREGSGSDTGWRVGASAGAATRPGAFPGFGVPSRPRDGEDGSDTERENRPRVGDKDEQGNTVIVSDAEEDITIVELRTTGYVGRIIFVPDPSRVVVRHTDSKNSHGEFIKDYLEQYGAIAGMNGNGFDDPEGHGRGGDIIGWSVSDGEAWGSGSKSAYASVGLTDDHVLMVGIIKDFEQHNIRDLAQYGPTLIVDGKKLITGSGGWGLQPRSAVGQLADGTMLLATFDGRQPGHSIGITAGEIADIFFEYGCVNAGLCDGGSSSVMMYDGKVLGLPSGPQKDTGRYLPNAFIVLSQRPAGADVSRLESDAMPPLGRPSEF